MQDSGDLTTRLRKCYSGAVFDALREHGFENSVLPHDIRPIDDSQILAGPVFTVAGSSKPGMDADESGPTRTPRIPISACLGSLASPTEHAAVPDGLVNPSWPPRSYTERSH